MNRLCFLLFLLLNQSVLCAQKNNFILKGEIIGRHTHVIWLTYPNKNGKKVQHKAYVKKGVFVFKGNINSPVNADLYSDYKRRSENDSYAMELFLSPGNMIISMHENDFEHAVITGSSMQDEWNNLQKAHEPNNKIRDSLFSKMFALERAGNTPKNHIAHMAIAEKLDNCQLESNKIDYNYIGAHPQSYLSAYLLDNYLGADMPLDSIEMFYNPFSAAVKNSVWGKAIEKVIVNRKASAVGSIVRMPSGINLNGSKFNPDTLKIKNYALLYFWADWANDNTLLKSVCNKYQAQGLKVLAISMDPLKKMWLDSVIKEKLTTWNNIFAGLVGNLDTFYNIREMAPSLLLLIDKNHRIIGRYRGKAAAWYKFDYDEGNLTDLDKKLSELYKK